MKPESDKYDEQYELGWQEAMAGVGPSAAKELRKLSACFDVKKKRAKAACETCRLDYKQNPDLCVACRAAMEVWRDAATEALRRARALEGKR